ncbi:hypothetical protein DFJ43DRAFT_652202 [Lentinula guzmanii]|uniref:Uncharacterized protein n=1 Tax=Lentinula guzmanii TaxID=2804957 RepID=A0AA38J6G8_9AGAR|nr:hypothetical protein DFJ43DRAFT_652202 [Lentinula guzmanii]
MPRKSYSSSSSTTQLERSFCAPPIPKRRSSLRLCKAKTVDIPIPPSLLQSPHLHSPMSPFRRAASTYCVPNHEDERWLRDTVPLPASSTSLGRSSSTKENTRRTSRPQKPYTEDHARKFGFGPCSPPLVRLGGRQPSQERQDKGPLCTYLVRENKDTSSSPT